MNLDETIRSLAHVYEIIKKGLPICDNTEAYVEFANAIYNKRVDDTVNPFYVDELIGLSINLEIKIDEEFDPETINNELIKETDQYTMTSSNTIIERSLTRVDKTFFWGNYEFSYNFKESTFKICHKFSEDLQDKEKIGKIMRRMIGGTGDYLIRVRNQLKNT